MDFFFDNGPAGEVKACDDVKNRFETTDKFILYQEEGKNKTFDDVTLTDLDKNGGIRNLTVKSVFASMKNFFKKISDFFSKKPKRIFMSLHQFFGCAHLMSVRLFIVSINECEFRANLCDSLNDFKKKDCFTNRNKTFDIKLLPRAGYHADKAIDFFNKINGSFFSYTTINPPFCLDPIKWLFKKYF